LAPAVVRGLSRWAESTGGRVVLVRRPGRPGRQRRESRRWFLADARYGRVGIEGGTFTDERELVEIAESGVGERTSGPASRDPLVLVCTHGRHDTCCAVRGRPIAAVLAGDHPERVWECSHIGGCRFAPAVVLLPHGYVLGATPESAVSDVVARYFDGEVDTRWLRGRSSLSPVEQAAQQAARARFGAFGVDALRPVAVTGDSERWRVTLAAPDCVVLLTERRVDLGRPLTCSMTKTGWQRAFDTIAVLPADHLP
jgi:hypothetical protein